MQASATGVTTDFLTANAFDRTDNREDSTFYQQPHLMAHLDEVALLQFKAFYKRFVKPGIRVLDLMSSWNSHLPDGLADMQVTGLGMNAEEMQHNRQLNDYVVRDLNQPADVPFAAHQFDLAICTVSVEYLSRCLSKSPGY
jgi:hypothetical protein